MGLGIKKFIRKVYDKTKEKKMIPVVERPSSGHEFDGKVAWVSGGSGQTVRKLAD